MSKASKVLQQEFEKARSMSTEEYSQFCDKVNQSDEITECPSCGSGVRDPMYPKCWHCGECGFAVCEYYKHEIGEIQKRRAKE